jgi:hypothetical protein
MQDTVDALILMCKDTPVYDIVNRIVLHADLLPGAMRHGTLDFFAWMKTRYSTGSNVTARRLMLRAGGTDNHNKVLKTTRALSLSDCYWLKAEAETVKFNQVTPYLNKEWDGTGAFTGGSISTLFVNGAADKRWINADTLVKFGSVKEQEPFELIKAVGLSEFASKTELWNGSLYVKNFTSIDTALESIEQSGIVGENDDARNKAIELFGWPAAALFVIDYLVEHDDRHRGNLGMLRDTNTGAYLGMAPYYDFNWAWSGESVALPENAASYREQIIEICLRAKRVSSLFTYGEIISKRAEELMNLCHKAWAKV